MVVNLRCKQLSLKKLQLIVCHSYSIYTILHEMYMYGQYYIPSANLVQLPQ